MSNVWIELTGDEEARLALRETFREQGGFEDDTAQVGPRTLYHVTEELYQQIRSKTNGQGVRIVTRDGKVVPLKRSDLKPDRGDAASLVLGRGAPRPSRRHS